jgi:uncharacterized DUF497 family protein
LYTQSGIAVTFDPAKDAINKKKHRISLSRAADFDFEAAAFIVDDREDYGEVRIRAIGFLDARLYSLVFAQHDEGIRAISLRKATRNEQKEYKESR